MSTAQLNRQQREAFDLLRRRIKGGKLDKKLVMRQLFEGCDDGCNCTNCRPAARLKVHAARPSALARAIADALAPTMTTPFVVMRHARPNGAAEPDLHAQEVADDDPAAAAMLYAHDVSPGPDGRYRLAENARGPAGDRRTMIHDLISDPDSPFTPEDEDSLRAMTYGALAAQYDRYRRAKDRSPAGRAARVEQRVAASHAFGLEQLLRAQRGERLNAALGYSVTSDGRVVVNAEGDPNDPAVAAMSTHEEVRAHVRQVMADERAPRRRDPAGVKARRLAADDPADPAVAAMSTHEEVRASMQTRNK